MTSIYDSETATTPDYVQANAENQYMRDRMISQDLTPEEQASADAFTAERRAHALDDGNAANDWTSPKWGGANELSAASQAAYNSYTPGGQSMYEGSGLFNVNTALFGGSGAAAEMAYGDINRAAGEAIGANQLANQINSGRVGTSNQYGQTAIGNANATLGGAANELSNIGNTGAANALAIRGVSRAGTEGLDIQGREASMLGLFDPRSATAAQALDQQTRNNAAGVQALGLSGRGGGANASAQARGNAMSQGIMAGEGLQQQQLAAQEYQSNQALALQALQGQAALGASQQQGALGNAQLAQSQQIAAANATVAGQQTQYGADAAANQLRVQQAGNLDEYAKTQQGLYGTLADSQQTLGRMSANYMGQAESLHQQQLDTEAQLRTHGLINAAQTRAGLQNTQLDLRSQADIQNQAAQTAMFGSMLSTGAGAASSLGDDED